MESSAPLTQAFDDLIGKASCSWWVPPT